MKIILWNGQKTSLIHITKIVLNLSMKNPKSKKTISGIKLKSYYGNNPPGEYPFVSGVYQNMYLGKLWTMRQYAGFSSAKKSNERYHYLLKQGVTGLSVAFDLPTQTGYDSDHEIALGEVGKVGVPISTIDDMRILLKDIPLDKVSISMTINSTAIIILAMLVTVAKENGYSAEDLKGTVQNDILKEYISRGTHIFPPYESLRLVTDIFEYCEKEMPLWNTISISGYHIREAGSNAIQELAFTFSNAIAYVDSAIKKGLNVEKFSQQMSFFFNCHNYFFEEIAKFRAARFIWSKIMKERYGVKNKKGQQCRFHTQTAGSSLQAQQIDNNIVRTTMQAAAAILGGTQSLHTNSKDEALSLPTESAAKTALRTQQILAYETGIADVIDPLAGSYYIENLTNDIISETLKLINRIDDLGGAVKALEKDFQQNEIANQSYDYQKNIENRKQIIVGNNKYNDDKEENFETQKIDEKEIELQIERLAEFKKIRNEKNTQQKLNELKSNAKSDSNLFPSIISAVKNNATIGEICEVLKNEFGEY